MAETCERCGRPATYREVQTVGGRKVQRQLCDEHAPDNWVQTRSDWSSWDDVFAWLAEREPQWPARLRVPDRMCPDAPAACDACGRPATTREVLFGEDGSRLEQKSSCPEHGGRR